MAVTAGTPIAVNKTDRTLLFYDPESALTDSRKR
jgi:hypothetical protein